MWLGPPESQKRITLFFDFGAPAAEARAFCCSSVGSDNPASPASPVWRNPRREEPTRTMSPRAGLKLLLAERAGNDTAAGVEVSRGVACMVVK